MGRRKRQPRSKTADLFVLALLLFLTFVGYNTAPSPYKEMFLFPLILFALFFIIVLSGIITKRRQPSSSNNDRRLNTRASSGSFVLLLALMLIGGGIYLFWPSVSEIISRRLAQSQSPTLPSKPPANTNVDFGAFDVSTVITWIVTLAILAIIGYIAWGNRRRLLGYIKRIFETPSDDSYIPEFSWTPTAKMDGQFGDVWNAIKKFKPTSYCSSEKDYQKELYDWLKPRFPDIIPEKKRGGVRADLCIGNIAIELKAHANNGTLDSLSYKVVAYPNYYERLYIVIFGHDFSERKFKEFRNGIKNRFPIIGVISKPRYFFQKSAY